MLISRLAILILIGLLPTLSLHAYNTTTDSLLTKLNQVQSDSVRVVVLIALCEQSDVNKDSTLLFIKEALQCADRSKNPLLISRAMHYHSHWHIGNTKNQDTILLYCRRHLERMQAMNYENGIALAFGNLGIAYTWYSLDSSLFYNWKSVELYKELKELKKANTAMLNLANVYLEMKRYEEAIAMFRQTAAFTDENGGNEAAGLSYFNISECYMRMGDYVNAEKCINKACSLSNKPASEKDMAYCHVMLGDVYVMQGKLEQAKQLFERVLHIATAEKLDYYLYRGNLGMAEVSFKGGLWKEAKMYKQQAWEYSYKDMAARQSLYKMLYACDSALGNYRQALNHYQQYTTTRDSFENAERLKSADALEARYRNKEKQAQIELLNAEAKLHQAEAGKQRNMRNTLIMAFALVVLFAAFSFSRYSASIKQRQEGERMRISRDLHDDVGATLGSISIYSEVAKGKAAGNAEMNEVLTKIGDSSREMVERMNDIVWSVNPKNDSMAELVQRMKNFAAHMLGPLNLHVVFSGNALYATDMRLEMLKRKNIFLIYKEALYNIVKYAKATQIEINLHLIKNEWIMEIRDNGTGFNHPQEQVYNGNGIRNMQQRAIEAGGRFILQTGQEEDGTTITVYIPV